jgi:hypothetical protein
MGMLRWTCDLFIKPWRARQRAIDRKILWPACKAAAPTIKEARLAFTWYVLNDSAYVGMSVEEIERYVEGLT